MGLMHPEGDGEGGGQTKALTSVGPAVGASMFRGSRSSPPSFKKATLQGEKA